MGRTLLKAGGSSMGVARLFVGGPWHGRYVEPIGYDMVVPVFPKAAVSVWCNEATYELPDFGEFRYKLKPCGLMAPAGMSDTGALSLRHDAWMTARWSGAAVELY